ncbi:uncharacterized protein MELLADRAFT_107008 [Melampsora larici-populina 98AG31]|uniref:RRM domain-containing protein n=1 Tax=Melampsora larici-populina (strain 98AG31 / pathotype 3-4-7) TaxID=747676 RepID=F4RNC9_MELLP|nr:uncharacterized protein MELLADRAFT_107008 [Melampsora larici-populina 98AG31]EGG05967.1 hypothetical protein MELLADRAFT_107008 [Melampsora larici-populina 98AG31]
MLPKSINHLGYRPFILNIRCPSISLTSQSILWTINHFESRFGKISYCKFPKDPDTEWYRGFGFIHFIETSAALTCLKSGPIHEILIPSIQSQSLKHGQLRLSDLKTNEFQGDSEIIKCLVEQGKPSIHSGLEQRPTIDGIHAQAHQSVNHEELQSMIQAFGGFYGELLHKRRTRK